MSRHIIGSEEDIEHLFYSCEVDIKNEYWTDMLRGGINPSDQYILVFLEGIMQRGFVMGYKKGFFRTTLEDVVNKQIKGGLYD